jgi:hypothetical protein
MDKCLISIIITSESLDNKKINTNASFNVNSSKLIPAGDLKKQIEQYAIDCVREYESSGKWPEYLVQDEEDENDEE